MFKVNRKIEYALIALKHMHKKYPGELTTAKEIYEQYKTPFDATSRVLQVMAHHGILKSEQGAHGGYQILKDLTKVTFLDLIEMIEGNINMVNCLFADDPNCELVPTCNIISPITWLNERLKEFYNNLSIHDLLETPDSGDASNVDYQQQFIV